MSIECSKCGEMLTPDMEACPRCGSRDRLVRVQDSCLALEMVKVKQKDKNLKLKKIIKQGEKVSKAGRIARETLIIDKEAKRKNHVVEEKDEKGEWVKVHEEKDKPL